MSSYCVDAFGTETVPHDRGADRVNRCDTHANAGERGTEHFTRFSSNEKFPALSDGGASRYESTRLVSDAHGLPNSIHARVVFEKYIKICIYYFRFTNNAYYGMGCVSASLLMIISAFTWRRCGYGRSYFPSAFAILAGVLFEHLDIYEGSMLAYPSVPGPLDFTSWAS